MNFSDTPLLEHIEGEVWFSPQLVSNVLREHDLRWPKDPLCACGQTFAIESYEQGVDAWIEHVLAVMSGS
jgi:hypothetical protein